MICLKDEKGLSKCFINVVTIMVQCFIIHPLGTTWEQHYLASIEPGHILVKVSLVPRTPFGHCALSTKQYLVSMFVPPANARTNLTKHCKLSS